MGSKRGAPTKAKDKKIAEKIKDTRNYAKFTQTQLAESLGVTLRAVQYWEAGKTVPTIEMLKRISEVCNCTQSWIEDDESGLKTEMLRNFTTDELLEEIRRRIEEK